jgi:hypothetical protein
MAVSLRAGVALVLLGCSSLPRPPTGPVPPGAPGREVPYPPPPARVETLPPRPAGGQAWQVWIDGQWDWDGQTWRWLPGAWVTPPANAYFTPWTATLQSNGRYLFVRAAWRSRDGRPIGPGFGVGYEGCPPS